MFGGEYLKYKSKQKEVIFSPSQYYLDKLSEYNFHTVEESNKYIHSHLNEGKQLFIYKVFVEESGKINMKISKKASGMINGYSALAGFSEAKELQQSLIMVP